MNYHNIWLKFRATSILLHNVICLRIVQSSLPVAMLFYDPVKLNVACVLVVFDNV